MDKVLVAGATGYLGKYIVKNLVKRNFNTTVLVRNSTKFETFGTPVDRIVQAEVTKKTTLVNCCDAIDIVISTLGITRQNDGLSYMDVDYQANLNLLNEAKKSGVRKFVYVSVLNGEKLKKLKICEAKEKFVDELKKSGLEYCIIRPNGFFSDMTEFYNMAKNGRIYLFGDGKLKSNPIHGEDLAQVCVDAISQKENEIDVGGPSTLSQIEIATIAFEAAGKPVKITHIPDWIRRLVLRSLKLILSANKFGPIEFFMNVMAIEMIAPEYGVHTLTNYFNSLNNEKNI
ncbi:SDR family oxidoreductase [Desulfosediminicola flagellatus]|uniref:SDR family oxidoreductase n=1 Tax=Desulfosediminicola flagellatus TaxID=2569541 RepID=UPI0010ACCF51|nr:SDR family oxidoreductase [Desulfosediminicola flagellatus]